MPRCAPSNNDSGASRREGVLFSVCAGLDPMQGDVWCCWYPWPVPRAFVGVLIAARLVLCGAHNCIGGTGHGDEGYDACRSGCARSSDVCGGARSRYRRGACAHARGSTARGGLDFPRFRGHFDLNRGKSTEPYRVHGHEHAGLRRRQAQICFERRQQRRKRGVRKRLHHRNRRQERRQRRQKSVLGSIFAARDNHARLGLRHTVHCARPRAVKRRPP